MKYVSKIDVFWSVVWALVLIGAAVSLVWKPAIYGVVAFSATMLMLFVIAIVREARMK